MVERERQGRTAPIPETNTRVLKTLVEFGVDASFDNLNLAGDRFTRGVKKDGEDTIFVGILKHPLAGEHLAQFLNSVAPFGYQDRVGIIDDVDLPILAERDYQAGKDRTTSEYIRLHERHRDDPRVGPPYMRFAKDHADSWLRALEFSNGWKVFERLQRIRFINSTEDVRRELFSEDGNIMRPLDKRECSGMFSAIRKYGNLRYKFFAKKKGLKELREREAIQSFLKTLSIEEQRKFAITYFMNYYMDGDRQIFVDLETHRIISDKSDASDFLLEEKNSVGKGVRFVGNKKDVVISDGAETKVVIKPTGQNSERFSWRVIEYQFPEGYEKSSLYPVIAWKNDENGTREFLTQQEAMPFVRELGLEEGEQGDVKLGEIAVASFARHIIKDWPAKMRLKPLKRLDDLSQPMRGAQMPAWVAVESHKAELLRSETSVLALAEQYFGIAA